MRARATDFPDDPLALALDRLIEQQSFDIHFQPLVDISQAAIDPRIKRC